jgi:NAD(P)-dependent dehydrogenase (short-subunit alcohol dehydrogenase family)
MKNEQSSFQLAGQVALVTASAQGIGKACALALAQAGADIILGLRKKDSAQALVRQIRKLGREVLPVQMDVTQMEQIHEACRRECRTSNISISW